MAVIAALKRCATQNRRRDRLFSRLLGCQQSTGLLIKKGFTPMKKSILLLLSATLLVLVCFLLGNKTAPARTQDQPYAAQPTEGTVPKSYGHVAAAIADQIGTGLVFEDADGTIRFVSMTGMKEGELPRYEQTATHGGIPKAYGHLVAAVVNPKGTGLVFEDSQGTIRFVTLTGKLEGELTRN
jgi:hypothetical protein